MDVGHVLPTIVLSTLSKSKVNESILDSACTCNWSCSSSVLDTKTSNRQQLLETSNTTVNGGCQAFLSSIKISK